VAGLIDVPQHPGFTVAPDGSWILFTQVDDNEGDIILMQQFR
jgi:hypothetical protein